MSRSCNMHAEYVSVDIRRKERNRKLIVLAERPFLRALRPLNLSALHEMKNNGALIELCRNATLPRACMIRDNPKLVEHGAAGCPRDREAHLSSLR